MLDQMRKYNPKEFFKKFKKKNIVCDKGNFSEFYEHFRSLSGTCEENDECNFVLNDNVVYDELESEIYDDEILEAIKKLKRNKAHGEDCLLNEFFIEFKEYILPYLSDMFNRILNSGHFPDDWSKAVIIPVFKKGDRSNPSDYRGISLISCLCKLFTSILNTRLLKWIDDNDILTDAQFGFRHGMSTVDAIFSLYSIIQKFFKENKTLLWILRRHLILWIDLNYGTN